jgi:hypothetical protein
MNPKNMKNEALPLAGHGLEVTEARKNGGGADKRPLC